MDVSTLKTLLSEQGQAYRGAVDLLFKQVNENVRALQEKVNDLTVSLEYTQKEVDDLKRDMIRSKQEKIADDLTIKKLKDDLLASDKTVKELEERANYQEDYNRRNNLQVVGVDENPEGETWEQTAVKVTKLLEDKLQLPNVELERAHRVGRRTSDQHRPIVARFARFRDREAVMRNVSKLRGTRIFVNEDLCPASQAIRREKLPQLKQARSEGKVAFFRHTKLIIKEKPTTQGFASASHAPVGAWSGRRLSTGNSAGLGTAAAATEGAGAADDVAAAVGPSALVSITAAAGGAEALGEGEGVDVAGEDSRPVTRTEVQRKIRAKKGGLS